MKGYLAVALALTFTLGAPVLAADGGNEDKGARSAPLAAGDKTAASGKSAEAGKAAESGRKSTAKKADAGKAKKKVVIPEQKMPDHFKEGLLYQSMNMVGQAIPEYEKALKADPKFVSSYNNLAQCLITRDEKGDRQRALELLNKAIELEPDNIGCYHGKALLNESEKNFKAAETNYRKILEIQPLNLAAVQNLSELLYREGKKKEARQVLEDVLAQNPPEEHEKIYKEALSNLDNPGKAKGKNTGSGSKKSSSESGKSSQSGKSGKSSKSSGGKSAK